MLDKFSLLTARGMVVTRFLMTSVVPVQVGEWVGLSEKMVCCCKRKVGGVITANLLSGSCATTRPLRARGRKRRYYSATAQALFFTEALAGEMHCGPHFNLSAPAH